MQQKAYLCRIASTPGSDLHSGHVSLTLPDSPSIDGRKIQSWKFFFGVNRNV